MFLSCYLVFVSLAIYSAALASFPHVSRARRPRGGVVPAPGLRVPDPPPGPLSFNGTKLVHDKDHPWIPPAEGDIRGPCPGLNTLASHGYLPRSGIATPAQIVHAVQEGFNMEHSLAVFATYAAFLVDGNLVTNLISIGGKTPKTGPDYPAPAIIGGMDTHNTFEGDASMTRGDSFFGDNHSFNETLFNQFIEYSNRFGAGKYNLTVAAELKWRRIQDSIATNPTFSFSLPRYFLAYGEAVFPVNLFVDGRRDDGQLDIDVALSFFKYMRMPPGFHRARKPIGVDGMVDIALARPIVPGRNVGGVGNFVPNGDSSDLSTLCPLYESVVNIVKRLYPKPTGVLRKALIANLRYFHGPVQGQCPQSQLYGEDSEEYRTGDD